MVVASALHALRELEAGPFDLVVADLRMPGMWGHDLLRVVTRRWPDTRRILFTGFTTGELMGAAEEYADATLDKVLETRIIAGKICQLAWNARRPAPR